jgi:hypothetical protein
MTQWSEAQCSAIAVFLYHVLHIRRASFSRAVRADTYQVAAMSTDFVPYYNCAHSADTDYTADAWRKSVVACSVASTNAPA